MKKMKLNKKQEDLCNKAEWDFSDLKAVYLNCTLKKSPAKSHTEGLLEIPKLIMEKKGIDVEIIRPVDYTIPYGVRADMKGQPGVKKDDWPKITEKIMKADILIIGTPIWLGEESSVCRLVIERLYGRSTNWDEYGRYAFYNKVAGAVVTGNEDGVKHSSMSILFALQHIGFTIPPQVDCGWIGSIGPGPSYLDKDSGGPENDFTNRNTTSMTWNLMHMARMIKDSGGIPAYGNQRTKWKAGCRFDFENPEYH